MNQNHHITLLSGRELLCYPKVEPSTHIDNRMKLDTTGQYLVIGRRKPVVQPTPSEEEQQRKQAVKFFTDHAFFFLDHRDKILSDSRMFLAPVPIHNALAYIGTSGFNCPTLGVYIEWWMNCIPSILGRYRKNSWLVYYIAGSPLSGRNACGIVNPQGECLSECLPSPFSGIWRPFVNINTRYDEAKERYEAYSLEEVVKLLEKDDQGDSLTERTVYLLQRENVALRQKIKEMENAKSVMLESMEKKMETMRLTLLKEYFESKREMFEAWYADYRKKQEEGQRELENLKQQKQHLRQQLRTGEINNKFYQQQYTPLKDKIRHCELNLSNMGSVSLSDILPESYKKYISPEDVIGFLNDKN